MQRSALCRSRRELSKLTHILLQNLASIQPRTSPVKFARPIAVMQALGALRRFAQFLGHDAEEGRRGPGRLRAGRPSAAPAGRPPGPGVPRRGLQFVANFWRAHSRLYQNEILLAIMAIMSVHHLVFVVSACICTSFWRYSRKDREGAFEDQSSGYKYSILREYLYGAELSSNSVF